MNFKNLSENLIITIVVFLVGSFSGHQVTINTALEVSKETARHSEIAIIEAIKKPTTTNHNKATVNVRKIKKSDSLKINLVATPKQKSILQTNESKADEYCDTLKIHNRLKKMSVRQFRRWRKR